MRAVSSIVVVLLVVALLAVVLAIKSKTVSAGPRLKAKRFMTANELEFLDRLERSVPELRFHAQVAMGALLEPAFARRGDARGFAGARNAFSQKIVDDVAQRRDDGTLVAVIELDDRTHVSAKDARRDAMLAQAGYTVVRWDSRAKPEPSAIRERLGGMVSTAATAKDGSPAQALRRPASPAG